MLIWLRSSLGDSYFSNNSPRSDSYSVSNLWGCLTFCPRMMPKTEITGVFSRPVSSCNSATHPLPFQEFSAIFLPSDSCRAVILWSPHSSSGGSPVWLMGTQQLLLHLCFLLLPDMSCILETSQLWLLWNVLFRLLSYPHTRGFGLFYPERKLASSCFPSEHRKHCEWGWFCHVSLRELYIIQECSETHSAVSITQCLLRSALFLLGGSVEEVGVLMVVVD